MIYGRKLNADLPRCGTDRQRSLTAGHLTFGAPVYAENDIQETLSIDRELKYPYVPGFRSPGIDTSRHKYIFRRDRY